MKKNLSKPEAQVEIITEITVPVRINRPVITVGTFDGVHAGHRMILEEVVRLSREINSDSAVVTFHPHPRIVLGQDVALLTSREEKRDIIDKIGVTHLIEIPFTIKFSDLEANEFISLLAWLVNPSVVIIGYDHGFGRNRTGDIRAMEEAGKTYGFKVIHLDAIEKEGFKISSSIIRSLLSDGKLKEANDLLGQPYAITGSVVRGNQIGKLLGYPTANLFIEDQHKLIPSMGVYASEIILNNRVYKGMTNIGIRPTLNAHRLTIETNIFDFNEDIYYQKITLKLIHRLRDEQKFENLEDLKKQLERDREAAILRLNKAKG
ncbi:MAG: bifunctional riboflavin kinase/FAD synthetase [Chloroflexota bacterium]